VRTRLADDHLRFAVCQYDSRPGAYDWNLRHALAYAQEAADHGAGFVILPEYSFCTADDALNGDAFKFFRRNAEKIERRLSGFSRRNRCYLLVNVLHEETDRKGDDGAPVRRNRSMLFDPSGELVCVYDKRQTAILDEIAGVGPSADEALVELPFGTIGLMVCRDASYPERFPSYRKADVVTVQFAHITDWTEESERDPVWLTNDMATSQVDFPRIGKRLARTFARPFALFANKTGFEPNGGFTGGACAISKDGDVVAQAGFGSDILYVDAPLDESGRLTGGDPVPFHPDR
jgi:predicted amidohydrolase